jgi:hypothetical protein
MNELIVNLHMHTRYSDGDGSHQDIIDAAVKAGIDIAIVTDHNTLVSGAERYFQNGDHKGLLLVGEEVHDQDRRPQKSHLLVLNTNRELATYASDPQILIDQVRSSRGLSFIAHPVDTELKLFHEDDISWEDWEVTGYTGIELWNNFSEFKGRIKSKGSAIWLAFFPQYVAEGPYPEILKKWDQLLSTGRKVVAVGGSDAHALRLHLGPIKRTVFPYELHFQSINTHILTSAPLSGELQKDKQMVYQALGEGHSFIGYDLPFPTLGFRFTAQSVGNIASMGDEIILENGATLQIRVPEKAQVRLLKNGDVIKTWEDAEFCTHITSEPGIYRVEVYVYFLGKIRGWIFSNPITIKKAV